MKRLALPFTLLLVCSPAFADQADQEKRPVTSALIAKQQARAAEMPYTGVTRFVVYGTHPKGNPADGRSN